MLHIVTLFLTAMFLGLACTAGAEPIADGQPFPDLMLELPNQGAAEYLGAQGKEQVPLSKIEAQGLIISVYSLYCPPCNRGAGRLNSLYRIMGERGIPVKIIGLAAGNSTAEVETYRDRHDVPFPLFKDPEYAMHEATGDLPVPAFYVVSLKGAQPTVARSRVGEVADEEEFLAEALTALGIEADCPDLKSAVNQ
jgi:peroxiredoxin